MTDILNDVFPGSIREAWRSNPTTELIQRLEILCASGPDPSDAEQMNRLRSLRARKSAWAAYLEVATHGKMLDGERGHDVLRRLQDRNPHNFRAALAECFSCWFLAGRMGFPFDAVTDGRGTKKLDMCVEVSGVKLQVEVKAPYRERPVSGNWFGDESSKIMEAMNAANKQFSDAHPNLLILVPELRVPMFGNRDNLLRAAYGATHIVAPFNGQTGEAGPVGIEFEASGRLLNTRRPGSRLPLKPDGLPGYRRISAILCLEERFASKYPSPGALRCTDDSDPEFWRAFRRASELYYGPENEIWIEPAALVLHNPHALHPTISEAWREYPQFVEEDGAMRWSDGHPVII